MTFAEGRYDVDDIGQSKDEQKSDPAINRGYLST